MVYSEPKSFVFQNKNNYCFITDNDDDNILIIPKTNLFSGENNEIKYISEITYDLIYNNQIYNVIRK